MQRRPIILLVAGVLVAGTATAWLFGGIAGQAYGIQLETRSVSMNRPVYLIGQWWGAFTGLIAGGVWCRVMVPIAARSAGAKLIGTGAWAGLAVGVLSTILLHVVLMIVSGRVEPIVLMIGLVCGVVAGLIVGAICGAILRASVKHSLQAPGSTSSDGNA